MVENCLAGVSGPASMLGLQLEVVMYSFCMCNERPTDFDSDACCNGRK